jgi:hypothetical protein
MSASRLPSVKFLFIALFLTGSNFIANAVEADNDAPLWKKAVPGAEAYLGDDGGGVDTITVCDTVDRYRNWLNQEHPSGCQTFQSGLRATIEVVIFDPVKDVIRTPTQMIGYRLAKVHIPARNFIGYLRLDGLHPLIPAGTIVHGKRTGNEKLSLYSGPTIKNHDDGLNLGDEFSAKVITYDPTKDDQWDLHVLLLDGKYAGKSGWMLGDFLVDSRGELVDQFSKAVVYDLKNAPR